MYLKNFSQDEFDNIYDEVKIAVCDRVKQLMLDLSQAMEFAAEDHNLDKFDDLIDSNCIK